MITSIGSLVLTAFGGCQTTPSCLEENRDYVAGYKDSRIGQGFDAGILRTENHDDAGDGEVNSCSEEGGRDGEADDLHKETSLGEGLGAFIILVMDILQQSYLIERIMMAYDSANVTQDFEYAATDQGNGEANEASRNPELKQEAA